MNGKKAFLIVVCLLGFVSSHAQNSNRYGLKAGVSIANQSILFTPIETKLPTGVLIRPSVAIFFETFKREKVSMQMDLAYVPKGNRSSAQSITIKHLENDRIVVNEGPVTVSSFQYLSFSPMIRYRQELPKTIFYTLLGPRIDYLLAYSSNSKYPLEYQSEILIGLSGAFGVEYKFNRFSAFSELQYQPDLSPLTNREPMLVNNNCLLLTVGVSL